MRWTLLLFFLLLSSSCSKELIIPEYEGRDVRVPRELSSDALRAKKAFSADYNEEGLRSLAEAKKTDLSFKGLKPLWEYAYTEKSDSVHTTIVPLFADEMSVRASNSLGDDDIKKYLKKLANTTFLLYVEPQDSLQKGRLGFVEYIPSLRCLERGYKPDPKTFSPPKGFDGEIALYDVKGNQKIHYVYVEGLLQNAYWVYAKEELRTYSNWIPEHERIVCYRKVLLKLMVRAKEAEFIYEPIDLPDLGHLLQPVIVTGEIDLSCLDRVRSLMDGHHLRERDQAFREAENIFRDLEPGTTANSLWMVLDPFFSGATMVGDTPAPVDPPRIPEPITRPTPQQVMAKEEFVNISRGMWNRTHADAQKLGYKSRSERAIPVFQDPKTGKLYYGKEQVGPERAYGKEQGKITPNYDQAENGVPDGTEVVGVIHTHSPYKEGHKRAYGLSLTDREHADAMGIFVVAVDYVATIPIIRGPFSGLFFMTEEEKKSLKPKFYMYQGKKK